VFQACGNATSNVAANGLPATDIWRYIDLEHEETINVGSGMGANEPLDPSKILHVVEFGDKKDNTIDAADGDSRLYGMDGIDTLNGGKGRDRLEGGDGNDILDGGKGADKLYGGAGTDTYKFSSGDGVDTIVDWDGGASGGDGQGSIEFDGQVIGGKYEVKKGFANQWGDATYTFAFTGIPGERGLLIAKAERPGRAPHRLLPTIYDFRSIDRHTRTEYSPASPHGRLAANFPTFHLAA
jgi:Ca2+-binding RTX toxin-like protein